MEICGSEYLNLVFDTTPAVLFYNWNYLEGQINVLRNAISIHS